MENHDTRSIELNVILYVAHDHYRNEIGLHVTLYTVFNELRVINIKTAVKVACDIFNNKRRYDDDVY